MHRCMAAFVVFGMLFDAQGRRLLYRLERSNPRSSDPPFNRRHAKDRTHHATSSHAHPVP